MDQQQYSSVLNSESNMQKSSQKKIAARSCKNIDIVPIAQGEQRNCPKYCQQDVRVQYKTGLSADSGIRVSGEVSEHMMVKQFAKKRKAPKYRPPRHEPGAQDRIQGIIKELCQKNFNVDIRNWVDECNGLCGGWATLHRANPSRFVEIWEALTSYEKGDDFEEHMETLLGEPDMGMDWENYIISFGDSAIKAMQKLEKDAGYVALPDKLVEETEDFRNIPKKSRYKCSVEVGETGGGEAVYKAIVKTPYLKDEKNRYHIVHIETKHHHMSLRTYFINKRLRIEEIVETEYVGVVRNPSTSHLYSILDHGIYFDYTDEDDRKQTIDLACY